MQGDVDRAGKGPGVLVRRDALDDRKRSHERVVTSVQASRRALERGAKAHDAVGANLSRGFMGLVEVDDQAVQRSVDGHFNYNRSE